MPQDFVAIAERIVDALLEYDPSTASFAGDHRFDGQLPDLSSGAVARDLAMLRDAAAALSQVDIDALDPEDRVDCQILTSHVDRKLFELTEVRQHEWNPLMHNPGELLYALIARPFAPPAQRLDSLAQRLDAIPDALATARAQLRDCPRIHLETALGQFAGTASLINGEIPALLAGEPGMAGRVGSAMDQALAALDEFGGWLRGRLDAGGDGRDPRLGRPLWEARLWHTLDTELSAVQVLTLAQELLDRVAAQLRELAAELTGGPATDPTVRAALASRGEHHPDNTSIVDLARVCMDETTAFVRAADLVSLVDDPCVIQEMPEFARGVAVAYCDPPGPLETADVPTFYCISPTPTDWTAERVASFYREYNDDMVRDLTVHEAMPGHFLQIAHSRRYRGATRVRALGFSGPFVEGWAVYAEELMAASGFGGIPVRLQQLKMQLRMALNAVIDQLVHCDGLTEAEAMAMMTGRGFQEEGEAAGKWRRALLTSTQLSTYFVGYTEVAAIGAARPDGTPVRAWHDAMLAHGSPPPRHLRALLGV
jgi:uncharacterized protein (DUF885 family)